jgi:chromate transporter
VAVKQHWHSSAASVKMQPDRFFRLNFMAIYVDIFLQFLRLGATSFGGPAAHLVYFERHFVAEKSWLTKAQYQQLVALCQFLPGPASSQVGIGIGLQRAGYTGALLAFLGFTLPSFALMTLAGLYGLQWLGASAIQGALCALVVIVAHAIFLMSKSLTPDWPRRAFAVVGFTAFLSVQQPALQLGVLLLFALAGALWLRPAPITPAAVPATALPTSTQPGLILLLILLVLLIGLPVLAMFYSQAPLLLLFERYFQAGALVFGGGHVVLPLLEQQATGAIGQTEFLAGYATAQLMPGPLFSFAAYLGAAAGHGVTGALVATVAIFLPGALLVAAIWPWWHRLNANCTLLGAVAAVNCAVVGLLAAGWWQFVVPHAVTASWHWLFIGCGMALVLRGWCSPVLLVPLGSLLFFLSAAL